MVVCSYDFSRDMLNSRRGVNLLFNLLLLLLVLLPSLLIHQIVRFSSINKAFTRAPDVAPVTLIMVFLLLDMAKWMVKNIILLKIHGVHHGVSKDIFVWLAARIAYAVLLLLLVILLFEATNNTEKMSQYFRVSQRSFLLFLLHFFSETSALSSFFPFLFPIPSHSWFPYHIFLSLSWSIHWNKKQRNINDKIIYGYWEYRWMIRVRRLNNHYRQLLNMDRRA